ncbi:asparaginase [Oceanobacillus zhaokaii]|uniref:asparaginase n=1 Tax=Oceanobacillus zhaokaii TaxID=2052660 RepID=A0A345PE45_9BACI|nr:asparaginase [Oceanobacillus zhaokaii]AXI08275.1 asparaginase [Oceanobacillus zhaokaii]
MKTVVLLTTGGTIASKRNPKTGLLISGALTGKELSSMCELPNDLTVDVQSLFQISSNQMTFQLLLELKEKIEDVFKDKAVDGIVVTHGTDTLEETAYFLDLTIADERPVVVTGSQRAPTEIGSDAFLNIRQAILAASNDHLKGIGTTVLFNEKILSARYIKKVHASNLDGFRVNGYGNLGTVDREEVHLYQRPVQRELHSNVVELPSVDIIPTYLGGDGRFIRAAVTSGAKGIVIEGAGRGHVPPLAVDEIRNAINQGVVVLLTTRADEGLVKVVYEFEGSVEHLLQQGVLLGRDYDSKKARIKLATLLAAKYNKEEIQMLFNQ